MENAIAIVGMDCKFPGANSTEEYWELLKNGGCPIESSLDSSDDPNFVNRSFRLDGIDEFDAEFFNISKKDAKFMDPQQRLFLESAWKAVEDAGYSVDRIEGRTGVFAGCGISTYLMCNVIPDMIKRGEDVSKIISKIIHGNSTDYLSSRVSYNMNFNGPSMTVQTACSSALTAVHLACRSLLMYECDMAVCGGTAVNSNQGHGYKYVKGEIFSKTGMCSPFSADADGTIFSGGIGTLVLKRYEDAVNSGDYIYAVIRGSAINNDGSDKMSYSAPSEEGQFNVIVDALSFADVEPDTISYIETHGTGTDIGDQIEISALKKVFSKVKKPIEIGSVKGNIGHAIAASGIAGLIKAVLMLNKGYICPSIHCENENDELELSTGPLKVAKKFKKMTSEDGTPFRVGVSSFGMGGSNAHLILESFENSCKPATEDRSKLKMLRLSAKTPDSLTAMKKNLYEFLLNHEVDDDVLTYVYNVERRENDCRCMILYFKREELMFRLSHEYNLYEDDGSYSKMSNYGSIADIADKCGIRDTDGYSMCMMLKRMWESGRDVPVCEEVMEGKISKIPLPGYVFDHSAFWIDSDLGEAEDTDDINTEEESDAEQFLKQLWKDYLGANESDLGRNFFELGGNSISAYQMLADIEENLGVEIDIADMIESPTIENVNRMILNLMQVRV